jgi:Holliday junction resolvase RusA-like endonuclease
MENNSKVTTLLYSNRVNIKPLSVNEAWQGKRFKSKKYAAYELELLFKLETIELNWDKVPIELDLTVGLSNMASDIDNIVKPFIDVLQKKFNFNDKYIFRLIVEKQLVQKNFEFIEFRIRKLTPRHMMF